MPARIAPSPKAAPWIDNPRGVVSLKDLLAYAADVFCLLTDVLGRVQAQPFVLFNTAMENDGYRQDFLMKLATARKLCLEHGWEETAHQIFQVEKYLDEPLMLPVVLQSKCADLESHLVRVLQQHLFFYVEKVKSEEYWEWVDGTKAWRENFVHPYLELASAAECYLFGKSVASVFHSMRALEIALQTLAKELNVPFEREQWEVLINNIEAAIKKIDGPHAGADWKKKRELYSEAALHFRYLKDAWRNHVMHVRYDYDDKAAKKIWEHASDFVADLSHRVGLKELKGLGVKQ